MKKLIREILTDLSPKPKPPLPHDLDSQILSKDPKQRVRQLDHQAEQKEQLNS